MARPKMSIKFPVKLQRMNYKECNIWMDTYFIYFPKNSETQRSGNVILVSNALIFY